MSAIALKWVASITVGNQTAKQLLLFYASHNFNKPGFEFKNSTLAAQLEVSERAIRLAHKLLIEKSLITRQTQYSSDGRQLSTMTYLNIPDEITESFFAKKEGGEEELRSGGGGTTFRGEGELRATLNNKGINNKKRIKDREAIPSEFAPNENHMSLAWSLNVDVLLERDKFFDWATANGKKMADWNAAFRNWLRKSAEYRKSMPGKGGAAPKEDVVDTMRRLSQTQGWN